MNTKNAYAETCPKILYSCAQTCKCKSVLLGHAVGSDRGVDVPTFLTEEINFCLECCYLFALEGEQVLQTLSLHLAQLDQRLCVVNCYVSNPRVECRIELHPREEHGSRGHRHQ